MTAKKSAKKCDARSRHEINYATIAIPLKFDNVSSVMTAKKYAKKCAARSKFLFFVIKPAALFTFSFPSSLSTRLRIFFEREDFFTVLAFRPLVNGVFRYQNRRFLNTVSTEWRF